MKLQILQLLEEVPNVCIPSTRAPTQLNQDLFRGDEMHSSRK